MCTGCSIVYPVRGIASLRSWRTVWVWVLRGDFFANEDAAESTWNDIAYACHFTDSASLQSAINAIAAGNKIIVELGRAFKSQTPTCDYNGPWGNSSLWISRVNGLVTTLNLNKNRLFAIEIFDEPDVSHGGPPDADLQAAVNYIHANVTDVPVFVNWFTGSNNTRVSNTDWYSTTKGSSPSALSGLGKPMFLYWFNNESNPSASTINSRWTAFVDYFFKTNPPVIASLGWCCDSIENYTGTNNNNSTELDVLLMLIGQSRRTYGQIYRSGYIKSGSSWWYWKRDPAWNEVRYTTQGIFPYFNPLPCGTPTNMDPAVALNGTAMHIVAADLSGQLLRRQWTIGGGVICWLPSHLNFTTNTRPDLFTFNNQTWLAARGTDNTISVRRLDVDSAWTNLGGIATSQPHFKVVSSQLRVAVYGTDGQVYSRTSNGSAWSGWAVEP